MSLHMCYELAEHGYAMLMCNSILSCSKLLLPINQLILEKKHSRVNDYEQDAGEKDQP